MGMNLTGSLYTVLKMMRLGNLVILCACLILIRHTIVIPFLDSSAETSSITNWIYLLMAFSLMLIMAGGYIINDFFDTGIDQINKPGKNKIGVSISKFASILIYLLLTGTGISIAFLVGNLSGIRYPVLVIIISVGLLFFYAYSYKKMFIVGNVIVSFMTALSLWFSILFDKTAMASTSVVTVISAYSVFAFMLSLTREIIKDCEDHEGDQAFGSTSIPLTLGLKTARVIAGLLALLTLSCLIYIQVIQSQWQDMYSFSYFIIFIELPLLYLSINTMRSVSKSDYRKNSNLSKLIMLTGILSMLVFHLSYQLN